VSWLWAWWALTALILANGLRLRARAGGLRRLPGDGDAAGAGAGGDGGAAPRVWLTAAGVRVTDAVRARVAGYAVDEGLEVVDLVPRDLPVEQALDLLRAVDPRKYRAGRLAPGATALQAMAVSRPTAERAGVAPDEGLDPVVMNRAATVLKRHAATSTDLVVVSGTRAVREDLSKRMGYLEARFGPAAAVAVAVPCALFALLVAGVVLFGWWGLVPVAVWCLQPLLALAGTALAPHDLWWRPPLRWLLGPVDLVRTVAGRWRPPPGEDGRVDPDALRPVYEALVADGTARFFEPARADCPYCGSEDLHHRISTTDLLQHKPGRFTLDECRRCGHIFQNPRLSLEGLDYYYRDFYDGLGAEQLEFVFGASDTAYRGRAAMLDGRHEPRRWLDVGAGHGHFCLVAKEHWPATRFDGLDMSESIEEAERRGWVTRGYRGLLPELAADPSVGLAGRYDVVSMHHYLEHTREQMEELDAARALLQPGGYLLIELPDPESSYGRLLGRYWVPWFQPQHQHLISVKNLTEALQARGMAVVAVERGVAAQPVDLLFAAWFLANRLAPSSQLPWRPKRRWYHRAWRALVMTVALPFFALALVADNLLALVIRRTGRSNTYRLLARVEGGEGEAAPPRTDGALAADGAAGDGSD
jgi:SAM-dependent methyltransferase